MADITFNVGDIIVKKNGDSYLADPPGIPYTILLVFDADDLQYLVFLSKVGSKKAFYSNGYPNVDFSQLDDNAIYGLSAANNYWELADSSPKCVKSKVVSNQTIESLSEQQRKDRSFFFKDLDKPYIAPTVDGKRIGLEFL